MSFRKILSIASFITVFCIVMFAQEKEQVRIFVEEIEETSNGCIFKGTIYTNKLVEYEIHSSICNDAVGWTECEITQDLYQVQISPNRERNIMLGTCWGLE
jgi:hypothetical protein